MDCSHDDRPFSELDRKKLRTLRPFLVSNIYLRTELLDELLSKGCVSPLHLADIKQSGCEASQVRKMLDILERRSYEQYRVFVKCLRSSQAHVATQIEGTGGKSTVLTMTIFY